MIWLYLQIGSILFELDIPLLFPFLGETGFWILQDFVFWWFETVVICCDVLYAIEHFLKPW